MSLNTISIPSTTGEEPAGLIVVLHTWGANAQSLESLVAALNLPNYQFLLPEAPFRHPEVWGGRMWYDLQKEDYYGVAESQVQLTTWLQSLKATTGIPLSSTIVMGFSQGGAMALDVGLHLELAGIISLSGYLHRTPEKVEPPLPSVLIVHGTQDTVVPLSVTQELRDYLMNLGAPMQYKEFDMGHEVIPEALAVIRDFIVLNT
ncbi:MAG: alpha/beta hydrolase [Symploca sp. SIO1B1]|nr:alpha/beta hydrolase [Symploca sp. SIO1B1]